MQRIAIIVPFPNIAVEYEFHKMIKNDNVLYQIFKIDYQTHQKESEQKFYQEMSANLDLLIEKIQGLGFDKIILMCSSLSSKIDKIKVLTVNKIVSKFLIDNALNQNLILISPYSEKTTQDTLKNFESFNIKFKKVYSKPIYGSYNYFTFGNELVDFCKGNNIENEKVFVSCTNIPVVDNIGKLDIVSSNTIVANYINQL